MSICEIAPSPRHVEYPTNTLVREAMTTGAGDSSKRAQRAKGALTRDLVEISEADRNANSGGAPSANDVDFARKALAESKSLSGERLAEIRARLQEGYYLRHASLEVVAAGLQTTLFGMQDA